MRYAIVLEYIGTCFSGSQYQPDKRTVQDELNKAVSIYFKESVKVIPSGRTDAGVHAKGQVAHFDIKTVIKDINRAVYGLNALLPKDISIKEMVSVSDRFHSQKSAKLRYYRYTISNKPYRSAFDEYLLHIREKLDVDKMNEALSYLYGEHNFACFKASKTDNPAEVCNVYYAKVTKNNDFIYIDIIANRFLYNMVRIMAGTLLDVGRKKLTPQFLKSLITSKDRTKASQTAPADALALICTRYDNISRDNIEDVIIHPKTLAEQLKNTQYANE